jgi:hypothetical protein
MAQTPPKALPDELQVIAAACRENSARIESLQLGGTVVLSGRRMEGHWDPIANRAYNSQTGVFSVWKQPGSCRFDGTYDHVVTSAGEVVYHVPYAEHIISGDRLEREGGMTEFNRKYGTPQTTERIVVTPGNTYRYHPEDNFLMVDGDDAAGKIEGEKEMGLALNRVYGSRFTIAERIERWFESAQRGLHGSVDVVGLGQGRYRIRAPASPEAPDGEETVVDLDKGGNTLSYTTRKGGQVAERNEFEYANVGGAWVLIHADMNELGPDGAVDTHVVYQVDPQSLHVNEPIDPQVFTFEGLNVRKGAHVINAKTREEFLYDDVPLHVKAALAEAREQEEDLAQAAARVPESPAPLAAQRASRQLPAGQTLPNPAGRPEQEPHVISAPGVVAIGSIPRANQPPQTMPAETRSAPSVATTPPTPHEATPPAPPQKSVVTSQNTVVTPTAAHQRAQPQSPAPPVPEPSSGWAPPATVVTGVVVGVGCLAALGVAIKRLRAN